MFCSPQRPSPPCGSGARTRGPHRRHHRHMPAERLGIGFHTARGATVGVDLRRDGSVERRLSDWRRCGQTEGKLRSVSQLVSPRSRCRISRFASSRRRRWLRTFARKGRRFLRPTPSTGAPLSCRERSISHEARCRNQSSVRSRLVSVGAVPRSWRVAFGGPTSRDCAWR